MYEGSHVLLLIIFCIYILLKEVCIFRCFLSAMWINLILSKICFFKFHLFLRIFFDKSFSFRLYSLSTMKQRLRDCVMPLLLWNLHRNKEIKLEVNLVLVLIVLYFFPICSLLLGCQNGSALTLWSFSVAQKRVPPLKTINAMKKREGSFKIELWGVVKSLLVCLLVYISLLGMSNFFSVLHIMVSPLMNINVRLIIKHLR